MCFDCLQSILRSKADVNKDYNIPKINLSYMLIRYKHQYRYIHMHTHTHTITSIVFLAFSLSHTYTYAHIHAYIQFFFIWMNVHLYYFAGLMLTYVYFCIIKTYFLHPSGVCMNRLSFFLWQLLECDETLNI